MDHVHEFKVIKTTRTHYVNECIHCGHIERENKKEEKKKSLLDRILGR